MVNVVVEVEVVNESGTFAMGSLRVHRLGFGTMQLTGPGAWGPPADRGRALEVLRKCIELGVDLLDTADSYGPEVAEELIHEALYPYPSELVIATKAGLKRSGPGRWEPCGRPEYLRQQCEGSLRRLGVESIDLFQLHRVDGAVPPDEQFGVLKALRDEGKVREVGLSEVSVEQVQAALRVVPLVSVQNQYHVAQRSADDVLSFCDTNGLGFLPWHPLASGGLARSNGPLDRVAKELGVTTSQVSLAWLLRRSPVMLPIPGTSSLDHLTENCAAASIVLSDAQVQELERVRKPLRRWAKGGTR